MQSTPSPPPAPHIRGPFFRHTAHDHVEHHALDPGRTLLGLVVLAVGLLYVLDSANVLDAGRAIDHWWPLAVIGLGVSQLLTRGRGLVAPTVLIVAGALLLLASTHALEGNVWNYVWPVVVAGIGVSILLGRSRHAVPAGADAGDVVTALGLFGGPEVRSSSQHFRHASLTAVFGGVTLDLRDATPDPAGAAITATAAFGGIGIIVPRGWRITTRATPIFGGIADKTESEAPLPADAPTLHVDGLALFGGVEVKHHK